MLQIMRKHALILLLASLSLASFAQDETRQKRAKLPHIEYRHDFRIGVGVPPPRLLMTYAYFDEQGRRPITSSIPEIYAFYGYRVVKGFKVVATLSYYNNYSERLSHGEYHRGDSPDGPWGGGFGRNHHIRLTPAVQYEWYNRGIVTMYSEVGLTLDLIVKTDDSYQGVQYKSRPELRVRPNVTPFGITVGKKWFGFAEVFSFGPRGMFNAGLGYRF